MAVDPLFVVLTITGLFTMLVAGGVLFDPNG